MMGKREYYLWLPNKMFQSFSAHIILQFIKAIKYLISLAIINYIHSILSSRIKSMKNSLKMTQEASAYDLNNSIFKAVDLMSKAKKIVVFSGAGKSF